MDSRIFINTPPTMALTLNRNINMNKSSPIYFKTRRFLRIEILSFVSILAIHWRRGYRSICDSEIQELWNMYILKPLIKKTI